MKKFMLIIAFVAMNIDSCQINAAAQQDNDCLFTTASAVFPQVSLSTRAKVSLPKGVTVVNLSAQEAKSYHPCLDAVKMYEIDTLVFDAPSLSEYPAFAERYRRANNIFYQGKKEKFFPARADLVISLAVERELKRLNV